MAKPPAGAPFVPPKWEDADVVAVQAVASGTASEEQQRRALRYIVEDICGTYDLSYRPTERDTTFAEGKRFVGLQVVKMTKINLAALRKKDGRRSPDTDPDRPRNEPPADRPASE